MLLNAANPLKPSQNSWIYIFMPKHSFFIGMLLSKLLLILSQTLLPYQQLFLYQTNCSHCPHHHTLQQSCQPSPFVYPCWSHYLPPTPQHFQDIHLSTILHSQWRQVHFIKTKCSKAMKEVIVKEVAFGIGCIVSICVVNVGLFSNLFFQGQVLFNKDFPSNVPKMMSLIVSKDNKPVAMYHRRKVLN